ncbi:MAG: 3-hydroxyacyl-CoA dehydrogenase [Cyclobacteriaceae bacterium]|nr:3-hydroxyacyl-CoA dehydrogenase [Cyclobacteriaceae bacterium]MCH8516348.1 3-hydroxyacyl-CoA dehydrogenase [Cyclobacteriaceae bacterium]
MQEIKNFLVVGAGTLGSRVALQAAISGYQVTVYDVTEKALEASKKTMDKITSQLIKSGQLDERSSSQVNQNLFFTLDLDEACKHADFINESVTEDVEIKKKVWKQLGEKCPEHTLFTTNTSYMLPSWFAEVSGRPAKFCAFHFHDVFYSRVVDVMPHEGTDPAFCDLLMEVGRKLNQVPVYIKKEWPGYIFNTMLLALLGAAGRLLSHEVASFQDIDRSWMVNFHMPMGPFGIMDSIGLDTAYHVVNAREDSASKRFAKVLEKYVKEGKLGEKTGEGFYKYPKPEYSHPNFVKP